MSYTDDIAAGHACIRHFKKHRQSHKVKGKISFPSASGIIAGHACIENFKKHRARATGQKAHFPHVVRAASLRGTPPPAVSSAQNML